MTIYATKVVKLIVEPIETTCDKCGTVHTMNMQVFQKYKSVFGLPLFPVNITGIAFCTHCLAASKRRQMTPDLLKAFHSVRSHVKMPPLWTWAGSALMAMIAGMCFLS